MGLFGRKRLPEEQLAKAREYFEKRDYEHAFLESHRLAGKKDPEACYYVGMYYLNKRFDKKMAKSFIEVAAAAGVFDAPWQLQLITGETFRSSTPVEAEKPAASEPVQETKPETVVEEKAAVKAAPVAEPEKVAEAKPVVEAKKTVEPETVAEEKVIVKSAPVVEEKKSAEHEVDVETLYDQGERMRLCGAPRDALMYYERAAARGHVRSQLAAAPTYETGSGTSVDEAKALAWYEKAAEAGSPSACCKCGALYRAAGDDEEALHWYQVAGDTYGRHEGWRECADMFLMGIGTAADKKKALEYYKLCALQDDAEVQCIYALLSMKLYTAERQNEKRVEAMK